MIITMMMAMTVTMMMSMIRMMMIMTVKTVTVMPPGSHQGGGHARLEPAGPPLHLLGDGDGLPVLLPLPPHPLQGLRARVPLQIQGAELLHRLEIVPNLGESDCQNIYSLQALYNKKGIYLCIYLVKQYLAVKLCIFR